MNHPYLIPYFWPGQIVPVVDKGVMERFHCVRYEGQELICYFDASQEHPGQFVLSVHSDGSVHDGSAILVTPGVDGFEDLGVAIGMVGTYAAGQGRARGFWPTQHTTAN